MIRDIVRKAIKLGACKKIAKVDDVKSLLELLYSAQGVEFFQKTQFPTIDYLRAASDIYKIDKQNVFVDAKNVVLKNVKETILAGDITADIICDCNAFANTVIVAFGAKVHIKASNYTVLKIIKISNDCEITIEKDNTVIILNNGKI